MADERNNGNERGSPVTNFQLFEAIAGVKLEQTLQRSMLEAVIEKQKDQETRLRSVERWKYSLPAAALLTLVATLGAIARGGF